ncbi:MAG: TIGR00645 family protein [Oligoflexia bacterium]|nr:TIGR00645 family protein [Oligoflexia bacterium]
MRKKIETFLEIFIFTSRWFQAPMYAGLVIAGVLYAYKFIVELVHLAVNINTITEEFLLMGVLTLVDIVMVANLLNMVIIGGYSTFVSRLNISGHEDRPDWLDKINAGTLKVKLAGALVGISAVHLLKTFINISQKDVELVKWQIIIHVVFLFSTLLLAITEWVLHLEHKKH